MRITHQTTSRRAIQNMSEQSERLAQLQARANGKAFQMVSDQPDAAGQALKLRSRLSALNNYQTTASQAGEWLSANEVAYQSLEDLATQAVAAVTRGLNDTMSASDRASVVAVQINTILEQSIAIGNSTHQGQYLFAGFQTNTQPFNQVNPNTVQYSGDHNTIRLRISANENMAVNFDGDALLSPLYQQLIQARNALVANDTTTLRSGLAQLQATLETISAAHAENGTRSRQTAATTSQLADSLLEVKSMLSDREDVNLAEAITLLRNQETTYQAVFEVSQRAISALNLFEYLR